MKTKPFTLLRSALSLAAGIVLMSGAAQAALIDTLYVTDGDSARLAIVKGNAATIATTFVRGYPLAVRNTIWIGDYNGASPVAQEFDLNGNATGNTAPFAPVFSVDGAVNGSTNYTLGNAFSTSATVYSANADWTNLTPMFSVGGQDLVGITYDPVLGSLWISDVNSIYEYSLTGTLLSSFAHQSGRGSLAYEISSDTLWYVQNGSDSIDQYSKAGALLDTVSVSNLASNNWGAEFAAATRAVPEPTALALFGIALAGLGFARRRRQH